MQYQWTSYGMYSYSPDRPAPAEVKRWEELRHKGVENWRELVRHYLPGLSDRAADFVLWELTSYPLGTVQKVEGELLELAARRMARRDQV